MNAKLPNPRKSATRKLPHLSPIEPPTFATSSPDTEATCLRLWSCFHVHIYEMEDTNEKTANKNNAIPRHLSISDLFSGVIFILFPPFLEDFFFSAMPIYYAVSIFLIILLIVLLPLGSVAL